ncbi:putative transposase [Cucumis melo var. makuwa]|uniref:Transposase n=1 Tax=Cucumis melo var. makuwa TaxID=1194695 RepID=A0A5A7TMA1_CUCMM|nr:putative transposase [Cucumis melo var. makuwa]
MPRHCVGKSPLKLFQFCNLQNRNREGKREEKPRSSSRFPSPFRRCSSAVRCRPPSPPSATLAPIEHKEEIEEFRLKDEMPMNVGKEFADLQHCPTCGEARYKVNHNRGKKFRIRGFNSFGQMSTSYSMWPVVLLPYNLPPWKCMKEINFFMSLLIPGPKSPGREIDVYLQPLIEELKELWTFGVRTYDSLTGQFFQLYAALLWTINDFPAYGDLSGWSTKGSRLHDGKVERKAPPVVMNGHEILEQLDQLEFPVMSKHPSIQDKKRKRALNWTKKIIFFDLPYWSRLLLRHKLDVMHIEKNVCDNLVGTLLNIEEKTKDTTNARLDLQDLKIRKDLHLVEVGNRLVKPHASYTLTTNERVEFCKFLKSVKFPDGPKV